MILMLSNMYPSAKYPNYGVFVKNLYEAMTAELPMTKVVLNKHVNKWHKLRAYIAYFSRSFVHIMNSKTQIVFVSYASYNAFPTLVARALGRRPLIITNLHGSDVTTESSLAQHLNFLTAAIIKHSDTVIVPSPSFKTMSERKYGYSGAIVSPSGGVDTTYFKPQPAEKQTGVINLGYISRVDENKGWNVVLGAVRDLMQDKTAPKVHLTMVGSGTADAECAQMIKDYGLSDVVTRIAMLPQSALLGQYNKLDVLAFPGAGTPTGESLGLVGLEAMACGVPVIGADYGGIATYVEEGKNGYLFDRKPGGDKSSASLAAQIRKFAALDKPARVAMSNNARATALRYDAKRVDAELVAKLKAKYGALLQ